MDARERARDLLGAVVDGGDLRGFLHPELAFRSDRGDVLDRDGVVARLEARTEDAHGHRFVFGDALAKRNVVFVSWQWVAPDGDVADSGTWSLSFGRDGRVTDWSEIAAQG